MSDEETKAPQGADDELRPAADAPEAPEVDEATEKAAAAAAAQARAEAAAKAKAAKEAAEAAKPPWERDPNVPEWEEATSELAAAVKAVHGESILWARTFAGDLIFMVEREAIVDVARTLHDEHGFTMLIDICGAHYPEREEAPTFEVVYMLLDLETAARVRLKVATDEQTPVPSVVPVWRGANWPEREVFDMYGVRFADHPDMTRILMWEGFTGHPLRKDFPVEGLETGSAIYPEYYEETAGPVAGTGTGWKPPKDEEAAGDAADD